MIPLFRWLGTICIKHKTLLGGGIALTLLGGLFLQGPVQKLPQFFTSNNTSRDTASTVRAISSDGILPLSPVPTEQDPNAHKPSSTSNGSSATDATPPPAPVSQPSQPVITTETITVQVSLPFKTYTRVQDGVPLGVTEILVRGLNGTATNTYEVTLTDGKETSRKFIKQVVTMSPIPQIVIVGQ